MRRAFARLAGLSLLTMTACGQNFDFESTGSKTLIVNGQPPPAEQNDERVFSTVAITDPINAREGHSWCTGTLIAPRVLITAGHCVGSTAWAAFGRTVQEKGLIRVIKQVRHPKFAKANLANDIAVYILEKDAPPNFAPAKIFDGELNIQDEIAVAGFGITKFRGRNDTGILRQANVFVKSINTSPTPEFILAGNNGEDTCQGDSGGPAYVKVENRYEVVGATSWGNGCGTEGHYTDLRAHKDFIQESMAGVVQ